MEWISVKERLPDSKQDVLVFTIYGRMTQQCWFEFTDQDAEWFKNSFTHWMPLPEPPKNS